MAEESQGLKSLEATAVASARATSSPRGSTRATGSPSMRGGGLAPNIPVATAESVRPSGGSPSMKARRKSQLSKLSLGDQDLALKGPAKVRHCTDCPCLVFLFAYMGIFGMFSIEVFTQSQVAQLQHARDHEGRRCSPENFGNKTKTYYPDLGNDYLRDPSLRSLYGICVDQCPGKGAVIEDYGDFRYPVWFASSPTLDVLGRCIPYQNDTLLNSSKMCAWPVCNGDDTTTGLDNMTQVCGLKSEETEKYWVQGQPETFFEEGWRAEGVSEAVIAQRMALHSNPDAQAHCDIEVDRGVTIRIVDNSKNAIQLLLERYLGFTVRSGLHIFDNRYTVLMLGVGFSILGTLSVISTFSICVRAIVIALIGMLFFSLTVLNYILFRKANWNTGQFGQDFADIVIGTPGVPNDGVGGGVPEETLESIRNALLSEVQDPQLVMYYQIGAVVCCIFTALLTCLVCSMKKHIDLLVQLTAEAAGLIREMPALLAFPAFGVCSTSIMAIYMLIIMVGVMTLPHDYLTVFGDKLNSNNENFLNETNITIIEESLDAIRNFLNETNITIFEEPEAVRTGLTWWVVFSFLYFYAFSVAIFTSGISGAVAQWYFFRQDPTNAASSCWGRFFGVPAFQSCYSMIRYHLGTLSFGAFVIALAAIPKLILEYIDHNTKQAQDANPMVRCALAVARCFLWFFEKCVKYMTSLAFINTAVTGKPFCKSAWNVFALIARHPAQLTLINIATIGLTLLISLTVPTTMAVLSYFTIQEGWLPCVVTIVALSFMVSYMVIDVYDCVILTLFICFVRDQEKHKAVYAPPGFREAMGVPTPTPEEIEMVLQKEANKEAQS